MARARNIKPGLFRDEELIELPIAARYLFIGLWTMADRRGRLEDRPKKIRIELLPYDDVDVDAMLDALSEKGFLIRYGSGQDRYIQIRNFEKHQNPHKNEAESELPGPEDVVPCREGSRNVPKSSRNGDAAPADSLIPDSLIPDPLVGTNGSLDAVGDAPDADAQSPPAAEIELSPIERRIISRIKQVRGLASVPDRDIALHLRETLEIRGSPLPDDVLLFEFTKFRDVWQARRSSQPDNRRWTQWRRAITEWVSRIKHESAGTEPAYLQYPDWTHGDPRE